MDKRTLEQANEYLQKIKDCEYALMYLTGDMVEDVELKDDQTIIDQKSSYDINPSLVLEIERMENGGKVLDYIPIPGKPSKELKDILIRKVRSEKEGYEELLEKL